jgi:glycosyltransferase involved in cell wall biosynthesis
MHVMTVIPEMRAGGAEQLAATLAGFLCAEHGEVTVASSGGWRADRLRDAGARLVYVPLRGHRVRDLARSSVKLRKTAGHYRPDLIHAHNVKATAVAASSRIGHPGPPLLVTLHGVPDSRYLAAARILSQYADELVAVSDSVLERIVSAGFPAARAKVIENAVPPLAVHPRDLARHRLGIADEIPIALCLARFTAQKRQELLIEAWRDVEPPAVLLLAGDGQTRPRIEEAIARSRQGGRIRLLGEREDVDWLLAAADVCVLPTYWEGHPISVLEAMSAGVPVVASAVPGVTQFGAEAVELVSPTSVDALAAGVREVLRSPARRHGMTRAGAALIATRFPTSQMWSQYRDRYAAMSAGAGGRRADAGGFR